MNMIPATDSESGTSSMGKNSFTSEDKLKFVFFAIFYLLFHLTLDFGSEQILFRVVFLFFFFFVRIIAKTKSFILFSSNLFFPVSLTITINKSGPRRSSEFRCRITFIRSHLWSWILVLLCLIFILISILIGFLIVAIQCKYYRTF